jgi:hypothetical protein
LALLCWSAALLGHAAPAHGWVFPEHVDITRRAVKDLETNAGPLGRAVLAKVKGALQLCDDEAASGCVALATLPALAGDHGCTPGGLGVMLDEARRDREHWLWDVMEVSDQAREGLKAADRNAAEREDVRRQMHVDLQLADPEYLARALLDYSHFQPTRSMSSTADLGRHLSAALAGGQPANATAAYVNFHVVALRLAARARIVASSPREEGALLARAFMAEAFALHFLEDAFSAGHFVGHFGDSATRLGTHDHYCRRGVEVATWKRPTETFLAHGDAFLSDAEAGTVAAAVRASLIQLLQAATSEVESARLLAGIRDGLGEEEYDTCARADVPAGLGALARSQTIQQVVARQPVPAPRYPALGRVRAESGFHVGGAATAAASHGAQPGSVGAEVRAALRAGVGAAAIVDDPLNAQAFLEAGFVGQYLAAAGESSSLTGYSFRIRAPGYLLFADGLVALLLAQALKADCPFCLRWGAAAAGGGPWKIWKSRPLFGSVSWQISALRDVSVNWFRNQPLEGQSRWEMMFSALAARSVLPIAGERWSQSTDFYLDVGPALFLVSGEPVAYGAFASFAMSTRVFP